MPGVVLNIKNAAVRKSSCSQCLHFSGGKKTSNGLDKQHTEIVIDREQVLF